MEKERHQSSATPEEIWAILHGIATRQGLFVIRATGSSASIINHEGFRPKRFDSGADEC